MSYFVFFVHFYLKNHTRVVKFSYLNFALVFKIKFEWKKMFLGVSHFFMQIKNSDYCQPKIFQIVLASSSFPRGGFLLNGPKPIVLAISVCVSVQLRPIVNFAQAVRVSVFCQQLDCISGFCSFLLIWKDI